ncbi:hypothetical protein EJB05_23507, partial [Eragrostis curvula]
MSPLLRHPFSFHLCSVSVGFGICNPALNLQSYHHREAELAAEKAKDMAKISSLTEELQAAEADLAKALGMVEAEQGKARQLAEQLLAVKDEYASAIGAAMAEKQVLWAAQSQHTARVRQLQAAEAESAAKVDDYGDEESVHRFLQFD